MKWGAPAGPTTQIGPVVLFPSRERLALDGFLAIGRRIPEVLGAEIAFADYLDAVLVAAKIGGAGVVRAAGEPHTGLLREPDEGRAGNVVAVVDLHRDISFRVLRPGVRKARNGTGQPSSNVDIRKKGPCSRALSSIS
jgi:hypothetical protein